MKYLIMLIIIIGLTCADFITGWIKAYIKDDMRSAKMRKGGLNKLANVNNGKLPVFDFINGVQYGRYAF